MFRVLRFAGLAFPICTLLPEVFARYAASGFSVLMPFPLDRKSLAVDCAEGLRHPSQEPWLTVATMVGYGS
jgi:hypothetical protein